MIGTTATVPSKRDARIAGVLYLLMGVGTGIGMGYADARLPALQRSASLARELAASARLFELGLTSTAAGLVAMLFLAVALYGLFQAVDRVQARLLVVFVGGGVAVALVNMVHLLVALQLAQGKVPQVAAGAPELDGLVGAFLAAYRAGANVAGLFWGLWLLPFGLLIWRSRLMPRALGALMVFGCFAYLVHSAVRLFHPAWADAAYWGLMVATLGEVGTILWLLIVGVRRPDTIPG